MMQLIVAVSNIATAPKIFSLTYKCQQIKMNWKKET